MDTLDFAILREFAHPGTFQFNVRLSNREVADKLDVDEETVRTRIRKLEQAGIIQRWGIAVHPHLLGRRLMRVELPPLPPEASRQKAMEGLAAMGGVYHVFDFYGGSAALVLYAEPGTAGERQMQLITALWSTPTVAAEMLVPPPTVEMEPADWRILRALRTDSRASHAELAHRAEMSERTLRRRLDALIEGRAVWLSPYMAMERAENLISTAVRVFYREPEKRGPTDERLKTIPGIVFFTTYPNHTQLSYGARRLSETDELRQELTAAPGVERVQIDVMLRRITADHWMDEAIEQRAR